MAEAREDFSGELGASALKIEKPGLYKGLRCRIPDIQVKQSWETGGGRKDTAAVLTPPPG